MNVCFTCTNPCTHSVRRWRSGGIIGPCNRTMAIRMLIWSTCKWWRATRAIASSTCDVVCKKNEIQIQSTVVLCDAEHYVAFPRPRLWSHKSKSSSSDVSVTVFAPEIYEMELNDWIVMSVFISHRTYVWWCHTRSSTRIQFVAAAGYCVSKSYFHLQRQLNGYRFQFFDCRNRNETKK